MCYTFYRDIKPEAYPEKNTKQVPKFKLRIWKSKPDFFFKITQDPTGSNGSNQHSRYKVKEFLYRAANVTQNLPFPWHPLYSKERKNTLLIFISLQTD